MSHGEQVQHRKENILRFFRMEDPFKNDPAFMSEFRSLRDQTAEGIFISKDLQDRIRNENDADSKYRLLWLAHELFPEDIFFQTQLASTLVRRKELPKLAERLLVQIVRKEPTERTISDLANFMRWHGRFDEALKYLSYMETHFSETDRQQLLINKAECFDHLRRYKEALGAIDDVLALNPENIAARVAKAQMSYKYGRTHDAITAADVLLREHPEHTATYATKALALLKEKRYAEALPYMDEVLKRKPDSKLMINLKARTLLDLKEYKECADFIISLGEDTVAGDERLMWTQAEAFGFLGDVLRCKQRLLQLLNIHPKASYAMAFVAMVARTDVPDPNELGVLRLLKSTFGNEQYSHIVHGAERFNWGTLQEHTREDEQFSQAVSNEFWSGLYDSAVDSNARTVTAFPHSGVPKI